MSNKNDFFIGWADDAPALDRRFFLGGGVALLAATGGMSAALAYHQKPGGKGTWDQGDIREWEGVVTAEPYPMLRFRDSDGVVRTAFLSCMNKCTPELTIDAVREGTVIVRGSPIIRGSYLMIATNDFGDWITPTDTPIDPALAFPTAEPLGNVDLNGTILDTKCWFGAMRPGEGKVHKACASLCIRSGLPPALYVKTLRQQQHLLVIVDRFGHALKDDILPYIADPIRLSGDIKRRGDLMFLHTETASFERLG